MRKKVDVMTLLNIFLKLFYTFAILYGLYNLFLFFTSENETIDLVSMSFSIFQSFLIAFEIIFSLSCITIIILSVKKLVGKLHLIYPIFHLSIFLIIALLAYYLRVNYGYWRGIVIFDEIFRYNFIIYMFDVIFPIYVLIKSFPNDFKRLIDKLKEFTEPPY